MSSDYQRTDENECLPRRIKCFGCPDTIIEVATSHDLRCEIVRMPNWDFVVVKVWATKSSYKRAQFQWLARMIETKVETEIEL